MLCGGCGSGWEVGPGIPGWAWALALQWVPGIKRALPVGKVLFLERAAP